MHSGSLLHDSPTGRPSTAAAPFRQGDLRPQDRTETVLILDNSEPLKHSTLWNTLKGAVQTLVLAYGHDLSGLSIRLLNPSIHNAHRRNLNKIPSRFGQSITTKQGVLDTKDFDSILTIDSSSSMNGPSRWEEMRRAVQSVVQISTEDNQDGLNINVLVVFDDSKSMGEEGRWNQTRQALKVVSSYYREHNPGGIDIRFLNEKEKFEGVMDPKEVERNFDEVQLKAGTSIGDTLVSVITPQSEACIQWLKGTRPLKVLFITVSELDDEVGSHVLDDSIQDRGSTATSPIHAKRRPLEYSPPNHSIIQDHLSNSRPQHHNQLRTWYFSTSNAFDQQAICHGRDMPTDQESKFP